MPILNKSITDIVKDELINHVEDNRKVAIYLTDKNNKPFFLMDDAKVCNNYEFDKFKKKWERIKKQFDGSPFSKYNYKLSVRIIETTDDGYQVNVLGQNVSLINHTVNKS